MRPDAGDHAVGLTLEQQVALEREIRALLRRVVCGEIPARHAPTLRSRAGEQRDAA